MKIVPADLHNHFSTKSRVLDPRKVVRRIAHRLGTGSICALVNYKDGRYEAFAERARDMMECSNLGNALYFPSPSYQVTVVKGEEVPTREGDLLVLGTPEGVHLAPSKALGYTLDQAEAHRACVIATSPFFRSRVGEHLDRNRSLLARIHAVEIHNGSASPSSNQKARDFFEQCAPNFPDLGYLSASDGHSFLEVGSSYTNLEVPERYVETEGPEGMLALLKKGLSSVRNTPYRLHAMHHSRIMAGIHAGIILSLILQQKTGRAPSLGDPDALR